MDTLAFSLLRLIASSTLGISTGPISIETVTPTSSEGNQLSHESIRPEDLQAYAKIEQELSIARRILIAETVEIEEFYDGSVKGGVGAKVNSASATLGIHGEGQKITSRIIKFSGFNAHTADILNTAQESLLTKLKNELVPARSLQEEVPVK